MASKRKILTGILVAALVAETAFILEPVVRRWVFPPQQDSAEGGRALAMDFGCFSCHGAEGAGGIPNPGSFDGVIPALSGGEMMMWAESEEELRHWIMEGLPLEETEERTGLAAGRGTDRAIVMPAYKGHIAPDQLDRLVAYLKSISGLQFPSDDTAAKGLEQAYELGCFRCHGPMGTGGVANPGSLKGYVPGFFGEDYAELVQDRDELIEWLRRGTISRLEANPLARRVLEAQAVKMPAYGEFLDDDEIEHLATVVEWIASGAWREMKVP